MEQKNKVRAELKFPFILIHTPFGLEFFDKVARTKAGKIYAKFNTYFMPLITALAIILIVGSLIVMFSNATAREGVRGAGIQSNLLIPGLNPYLPVLEGWIALIITIIIHEAGHGIVARVYNLRVDSTGILLILGLPIGAFVNIEREELSKATLRQKAAVLTAGPLNNMIFAGISLVALFFVVSTLVALPIDPNEPQFGVVVMSIGGGTIAESIGLTQGSVIQSIAGERVENVEDLGTTLRNNLGNNIEVTWQDENGNVVTESTSLPPLVEQNRGILGITVTDVAPNSEQVLDRYKSFFTQNPIALLLPPTMAESAVPFSSTMAPKYTSIVFGDDFIIVTNILFWLWFINFNVGIFNALPIGPLDGGQLYGSIIESRTKSKAGRMKNASMVLTLVMTAIVAMTLILPYLLR